MLCFLIGIGISFYFTLRSFLEEQTKFINTGDTTGQEEGSGSETTALTQEEIDKLLSGYSPPIDIPPNPRLDDDEIGPNLDPIKPDEIVIPALPSCGPLSISCEALAVGAIIQVLFVKAATNFLKGKGYVIVEKAGKVTGLKQVSMKSLRQSAIKRVGTQSKAMAIATNLAEKGTAITKSVLRSMLSVGGALFIFDVINFGLDVADVDGYANVYSKQAYLSMKKEFDKSFNAILDKTNSAASMIVGPLDDIPGDVLSDLLSDKALKILGPRIDALTESYVDYLIKGGITDQEQIVKLVTERINKDIDMNAANAQAFKELCQEKGGFSTKSVALDGSTVGTYCSFVEAKCQPNVAYSWPLVINSTTPVLTTSQYTKDLGTYYIGAHVVIDGIIDPDTKESQIGYISNLDKLNQGLVEVTYTNPPTTEGSPPVTTVKNVAKNTVHAVYSDTYVEYKKNPAATPATSGITDKACVFSDPTMRSVCYDAGLQFNPSTGICDVTETYCRSKALEWKYNKDIGAYDCYLGQGTEIYRVLFGTTLTSKITQVFDLAQYESCKPGEIDALYQCSSCPPGYVMDNLMNDYLQKSIKAGQITAGAAANTVVGVPLAAAAGVVVGLASGFNTFLNSFCYKECPPGMYGIGPVCFSTCPPGFRDFGVGCEKPAPCGMGVGEASHTKLPSPRPCPDPSDFDFLGSCWTGSPVSLIRPGYDPAGRNMNGVCAPDADGTEYDLIASVCYSKCRPGTERDGLLCYPKCKPGYHKWGCCVCVADCPPNTTDSGIKTCTKNSIVRDTKFVLPRAKKRIVPFSEKVDKPVTLIVDKIDDMPEIDKTQCGPDQTYSLQEDKCVPISCPDGYSWNSYTNNCQVTCPDPKDERFNGLCYRSCASWAAEKGLDKNGLLYEHNPADPSMCVAKCPEGFTNWGTFCSTCGYNEVLINGVCYNGCQDGYTLGTTSSKINNYGKLEVLGTKMGSQADIMNQGPDIIDREKIVMTTDNTFCYKNCPKN